MQTETIDNPKITEQVFNTETSAPHATKNSFLQIHIFSQKLQIAAVVLLSFLRSCSSFLLAVITGEFFMLQFNTGGSKGRLLSWLGIHLNSMNQFFLLFGILLLSNFVISYFQKYHLLKQGEIFVRNIREILFSAQIKNTVEQFNARPFGNYLLRYSNDMQTIQNYLTKGILAGMADVMFVSIGIFLLFKIYWLLGALAILLFLLAAVAIIKLSARQKKFIRRSRDRRSNMLAYVARSFSRFKRIKTLEREEETIRRYRLRSKQLFNANLRNGKVSSLVQSAVSLTHFLVIGVILWMISSNNVPVSSTDGLVALLILMQIRGALRRLLGVPSIINKWKISINKIEIISNPKPLETNKKTSK